MSTAFPYPHIPKHFVTLVREVTSAVGDAPLDDALCVALNTRFPAGGSWFEDMQAMCRSGCAEGWLCAREAGGIRFGRPVKPGPETHGFSVDVVEMDNIVGPHHAHPKGEIDLVMPFDSEADFDGIKRGWKVYPPGSSHRPTVSHGKALVLYLLPDGLIEFTR